MNRFITIVILLFVWIYQCEAQSETQCEECFNSLTKLYNSLESNLDTLNIYRIKLNESETELKKIYSLLDSIGFQVEKKYPFDSDIDDFIKEDQNTKLDSAIIQEYISKIERLENEILQLKIDLDSKDNRINQLLMTVDSLIRENNLLIDTIRLQKRQIENFLVEIEKLTDKVSQLQSIINCVNKFALRQEALKINAESNLNIARELYSTIYPTNKRKGKDNYVYKTIDKVVSIYNKYQTTSVVMDCPNIAQLEYTNDNLKVKDDFYLMRIYAFNEGNVIDSLNQWDGNKNGRQKSVGLALKHLGNLMQKGNYDDKTLPNDIVNELVEIVKNLGFYIVPSKTENSDKIALYKVIEYYNKGRYDSALSQYNKFERFINAENTALTSTIIHDIQFKIASIITWQLAPISRDRSIYPQSSWLYKISGDPMTEGKEMIQNLLQITDLDIDIKRKCIITKAKIYDKA